MVRYCARASRLFAHARPADLWHRRFCLRPHRCFRPDYFQNGQHNFRPALSARSTRLDCRRRSEWMFARQWSAKVEYLYLDLGPHMSATRFEQPQPVRLASIILGRMQDHIVRAGVNYHFWSPRYLPMKLSPASRRAFSLWGHARGKGCAGLRLGRDGQARTRASLGCPAHPVLRLMRKGRGCPGQARARRERLCRRFLHL